MQNPGGLGGVILAAGNSSRMGKDKAMLPWPPPVSGATTPCGGTLLSSAISAFAPRHRAVVVVGGNNADPIAALVASCGAHLVRNPDPSRGQFSSLQIGLGAILDYGCDSVMFTPVDCPPLAPSSLTLLQEAFERALTRGLWAVAPEHGGRHGHPLLISRELIDAFINAPVSSNAREILRARPDRIEYIPVSDDLTLSGMNTPEEYAAYVGETGPHL
jgi:molybdenum cofactor cytidylyltransferase